VVEEYEGTDPLLLIANGSYQLEQVLRAGQRLQEAEMGYRIVYLQEPGRFRAPRDRWELESLAAMNWLNSSSRAVSVCVFCSPICALRLFVAIYGRFCRMPATPMCWATAIVVALWMSLACSLLTVRAGVMCWLLAHVLQDLPRTALLTIEEAAAVAGKGDPPDSALSLTLTQETFYRGLAKIKAGLLALGFAIVRSAISATAYWSYESDQRMERFIPRLLRVAMLQDTL